MQCRMSILNVFFILKKSHYLFSLSCWLLLFANKMACSHLPDFFYCFPTFIFMVLFWTITNLLMAGCYLFSNQNKENKCIELPISPKFHCTYLFVPILQRSDNKLGNLLEDNEYLEDFIHRCPWVVEGFLLYETLQRLALEVFSPSLSVTCGVQSFLSTAALLICWAQSPLH